jgi:hypothetical protein
MQLTQENRACVAEIKRLRAEDQDWRDKCLKLMPRLEALVQRGEAMSKPLPEATTGLDGLPSGSWVPRPKKTTVTKRKRK